MEVGLAEKSLSQVKKELICILPDKFKKEFELNSYICGGAIYSLINDKDVNDYDFFIADKALANKIHTYFKSLCEPLIESKNLFEGSYAGHKILVSNYAVTIDKKYQIVIKYVGIPKEVAEQFDFKHNMFAFEDEHIVNYTDWEYIYDSKLHFNNIRSRDICGTIMRIPKMMNKGFSVSKREVAGMLQKLSENGFDEREQEIINDYTTY